MAPPRLTGLTCVFVALSTLALLATALPPPGANDNRSPTFISDLMASLDSHGFTVYDSTPTSDADPPLVDGEELSESEGGNPPWEEPDEPDEPQYVDQRMAVADDLVSSAESLISHHGDYRSAMRRFRLASILGHSGAAATTGALLAAGDGHLPRDMGAAVSALRLAARDGQPDALALLGVLHASGLADRHGVAKSVSKALVYWTIAAGTGNVFANTALGFRYMHGIWVQKDCKTAAKHYKKAAHAIATDPRYWPTPHNFQYGDAPLASSLVSVGRTRLKERMFGGPVAPNADDVDLFYYHRHLAEAGNSNSMTLLGSLLLTGGLGMDANHGQAREHLQRAADVGHGEAHGLMGHLALKKGNNTGAIKHFRWSAAKEDRIGHFALGMLYLHGLAGMEKDYSKAAMHFELAAERKHASASFQLGMLYWRGEGRQKSVEKAFEHFLDAAKLGNIQSKLNLGMILLDGLHPAPEANCSAALRYFKEVAEEGEWNTLFDLGLGAFDRKDMFGSLYRHSQAAHAGIELGQYNAAMILEMTKEGEIPELTHWSRERTIQEMQELYDMSGRQRNAMSYLRSGDVTYLENKDYASALESYNNAAHLDNGEGLFSVGMMYANGVGVELDRTKALDYLYVVSGKDTNSAIAANLAIFGLKTYWCLYDAWEWWTKLLEDAESNASVDAEAGDTESQGRSEDRGRITSSKQVKARTVIGDDLALVGGLLLILIAVLVVRSKRLARQSIDGEVA